MNFVRRVVRGRTAAAALAATCPLVIFGAPTVTEADAASPPSAWVTYTGPHHVESNRTRPQAVQDLAHDAAALVEDNKSAFLGSYIDAAGKVVLVPGSTAGRTMASALASDVAATNADLVVQPATISVDGALAMGRLLHSLVSNIVEWGGNPQGSGIYVGMPSEPTADERRAIEEFAETHGIAIEVEVNPHLEGVTELDSRYVDTSPYAGGARVAQATGSGSGATLLQGCSMGWGYKIGSTEYMLTAGHCLPRNGDDDFMWIYNGPSDAPTSKEQYVGRKYASTWVSTNDTGTVPSGDDNAMHGDLALVNVTASGRNAGDMAWWGDPNATEKIPVTGRVAPTEGDPIILNGMISGSDRGSLVLRTNIEFTYTSGNTISAGDRAEAFHGYDCPKSGDSGGGVVLDHSGGETQATAVGVISAGNVVPDSATYCQWYFTGVEEAIQAWGGGLIYH